MNWDERHEDLLDRRAEHGHELGQGLLDRREGALVGGQRLGDVELARLVRDDDIGERTARVDGDPVWHAQSYTGIGEAIP